MKTVKYLLLIINYRPSVKFTIATDWGASGVAEMLLNVQSEFINIVQNIVLMIYE